MHADGLANGLDLGVGGRVRKLFTAVDAGGKFGSGGVVKHRPHGDVAGRRTLGDVEGAAHPSLGAQQGLRSYQ